MKKDSSDSVSQVDTDPLNGLLARPALPADRGFTDEVNQCLLDDLKKTQQRYLWLAAMWLIFSALMCFNYAAVILIQFSEFLTLDRLLDLLRSSGWESSELNPILPIISFSVLAFLLFQEGFSNLTSRTLHRVEEIDTTAELEDELMPW